MSMLALIQVQLFVNMLLFLVVFSLMTPPASVLHSMMVRLQRRHPSLPLDALEPVARDVLEQYAGVGMVVLFVWATLTGGTIGLYRGGIEWGF